MGCCGIHWCPLTWKRLVHCHDWQNKSNIQLCTVSLPPESPARKHGPRALWRMLITGSLSLDKSIPRYLILNWSSSMTYSRFRWNLMQLSTVRGCVDISPHPSTRQASPRDSRSADPACEVPFLHPRSRCRYTQCLPVDRLSWYHQGRRSEARIGLGNRMKQVKLSSICKGNKSRVGSFRDPLED